MIPKFIKNIFAERVQVTFFMKSGNKIILKNIRGGFKYTPSESGVSGIRNLEHLSNQGEILQVPSICLDQIEAITLKKMGIIRRFF